MTSRDAVVKIDKELLRKIEEFVKKNKYSYSSYKQVVNLAIIEFLRRNGFLKQNSLIKSNKKRGKNEQSR